MPDRTSYVTKIRSSGWDSLRGLWRRILDGDTADWPPGLALEYLVIRMFELDGAEVRWPFEVKIGDETVEQIDGAVYLDHLAFLVESKDSSIALDVAVLAKIRSQLARRPAGAFGLVVSRAGFTGPAMTLARYFAPQTVLLMNGAEVEESLQGESIRGRVLAKYHECVEEGAQQPFALMEDRQ